jgi:hypothetical protein
MALPIIMFFFLVVIAVSLFVIGFTRYSLGAGFSFTALSGVFLILTGLLLWTGGLQTGIINSWNTSVEPIVANYEVLTFAVNPEMQLLSYFFTFGGFFPIIFAIRNVFAFKSAEARKENFDWSV